MRTDSRSGKVVACHQNSGMKKKKVRLKTMRSKTFPDITLNGLQYVEIISSPHPTLPPHSTHTHARAHAHTDRERETDRDRDTHTRTHTHK